jgi:hypothetical protein
MGSVCHDEFLAVLPSLVGSGMTRRVSGVVHKCRFSVTSAVSPGHCWIGLIFIMMYRSEVSIAGS